MTENESRKFMRELIRRMESNRCLRMAEKDYIIKALKEVQQYRALGTTEDLKAMKEHGAFTGMELAQLAVMQMRLREYEQIGTPEECLRNKDFLDFLADEMNPNDFETYLHIYNSQDEKGDNHDGE